MGRRAAEEYAGIEHGTLCANMTVVLHRTFHFNEACVRNPFNFIQRTFFFVNGRFYSRSVVFKNNCYLLTKLVLL